MADDLTLSFRPVTDDDYEYVYQLDKTTMRAYTEQAYGPWDDIVVRPIFAESWHPDTMRIVLVDGQDAGLLDVIPIETSINLEAVWIAPEHQGKGIGTRLISGVLRDAQTRGLPVTLRVLKVNPARRLYERLGFVVVSETVPHYLMEARLLSLARLITISSTSDELSCGR